MENRYGVDVDYFINKMASIMGDLENYTPKELARSLARLANTTSSEVLQEAEFRPTFEPVLTPEGFSLVPSRMTLDLEAMGRLVAMTGDSMEEEDFGECTLWVGETVDDDGERFYGLNASLTDYPEEGALPIIEFQGPVL
ncbi:hypothetical protein [Marinobacter salsuginis]|jgi:hypothetical protein|uniref:Uncharacterized protein n=1 Tax=Marinobacter salsuginis TaxID=418719 RepID=A0A5M3Q294_9GAMM|nr:hypothetical protein [Marinobacter salsuginis]GBO89242.1 hypothetical protein MSSD14B_29100 [Marinobacter salsuginis]